MIGRADIEGSKSNVAMNAWLPQASSLYPDGTPARGSASSLLYPGVTDLKRSTLSGGGRLYLRRGVSPAHTLPVVETRSPGGPCRLLIVPILRVVTRASSHALHAGVLPQDAWYRRLDGSFQQPGVSPYEASSPIVRPGGLAKWKTDRLATKRGHLTGTIERVSSIPVVTFLTPLA